MKENIVKSKLAWANIMYALGVFLYREYGVELSPEAKQLLIVIGMALVNLIGMILEGRVRVMPARKVSVAIFLIIAAGCLSHTQTCQAVNRPAAMPLLHADADGFSMVGVAVDLAALGDDPEPEPGGVMADFALAGGNDGLAIAASDPDSPYFDTSQLSMIGRFTHWLYGNRKWTVPVGSALALGGGYMLGDAAGWWGGGDSGSSGESSSESNHSVELHVNGNNNNVTVTQDNHQASPTPQPTPTP